MGVVDPSLVGLEIILRERVRSGQWGNLVVGLLGLVGKILMGKCWLVVGVLWLGVEGVLVLRVRCG